MENYEDIINLSHHKSSTRKPMSNHDRAAQFAPFAALTGYESLVDEAARYTDRMVELSDEEKNVIDKQLQFIREHLNEKPKVSVTYFVPDKLKSGGTYKTITGIAVSLNETRQTITIDDTEILYEFIYSVYI